MDPSTNDTGKIAKIRSFGFFMKGIVYVILGALTFMAALGWGGDVSSRNNVIKFLLDLPLGKALIGVASLGLFAYALWRFYQAIKRPKEKPGGKKIKSIFKKIRYFYSGALYGTIAYSFAKPLIGALSGNGEARVEDETTAMRRRRFGNYFPWTGAKRCCGYWQRLSQGRPCNNSTSRTPQAT